MFIVGKKSDQTILHVSGTYQPNDPSDDVILTNVKNKHGGVDSDYSILHLDNSGISALRILNGDEYDVVWSDVSPDGEISDVDFTTEDNKKFVKVSIDKNEIDGDGIDEAVLTVEIWQSDQSGIATNINTDVSLPVITPDRKGIVYTPISIINGVGTININTTIYGRWTFPGLNKRYKNFRILNNVHLDVRVML